MDGKTQGQTCGTGGSGGATIAGIPIQMEAIVPPRKSGDFDAIRGAAVARKPPFAGLVLLYGDDVGD